MSDKDRLIEAMMAEQETFREYLYGLTAEEALNHAYEYIVREDILYAVDGMELTPQQARNFLSTPSPLDYIYNRYLKYESAYMEEIREVISDIADR